MLYFNLGRILNRVPPVSPDITNNDTYFPSSFVTTATTLAHMRSCSERNLNRLLQTCLVPKVAKAERKNCSSRVPVRHRDFLPVEAVGLNSDFKAREE